MEVGKKKLFYKLMSFVTGFVVTTLVGVMIQYCLKMCEKNGFVNEYEDIINLIEKARSKNNLVKLEKTFQGLKKQLENKKFIKNAPKSLVAERKSQLKESKVKIKKLNDHLKVLELI